ncbi:hypothetical protein EsDP_00006306 [Epichloe bromicola]|uniref:Uncharacterized protein n=1 Tax=Epichloe bromicola TaxID=79588 RepID=A0ABQ0CX73_9HYPO
MTRSLTIRKRQKAKTPPPLPEDLIHPGERSLLAIPNASKATSSPPVQLAPARIPNSPSTLCASPPLPAKPMSSSSSSMYPSSTHSTHSTVLPESAHSSIYSPFAPPGPVRAHPSAMAGRKRSSVHAAKETWDDVYGGPGPTYEVEAENELPAYLAPHIIGSERDEDQPAELFATPPPRLHQVVATASIHTVAFSSRKNSQCAETESVPTTPRKKKKRRSFWGTFRLGGKQSVKSSPGEEPPLSLSGNTTRHSRLDSNTDTLATEESAVTPDAACPWEAVHGNDMPAKKTNCSVNVVSREQDERGTLDPEEVVAGSRADSHECGSNPELCHTIVVEIPGDHHFGNDFWARFPRRFI